MRPFKFRFWNVREGKWEKNLGLYEDGCIADLEQCFHNQLESSDFVIQQFTGLHDKSGNEIYEGDILSLTNPNNGMEIISEVVFEQWAWRLKNKKRDDPFANPNRFEVKAIGNIFENAELLK